MSIALAIARFITPPRMLPAPDPTCLTYDYNESWVMHRNRERYFAESTSQPSPSECLPANVGVGCGSFARDYEMQEMLDGRYPTTDTYGA